MDFKTRAHEWLADHISWVQYPQVRPLSANAKRRVFRTDMHWTTRALIVMGSAATLAVSGGILAFLGLIVWATVTA